MQSSRNSLYLSDPRVLVYIEIDYLESHLYKAGAAIKSNSSFPEPLEGVCGCTCSKWSLIARELCLPFLQIKFYRIKCTPLVTSHFSSAVSILQDPNLYFEISPITEKRLRDERVSRNRATNVSTLFLTTKQTKHVK